MLTSYGVDHAFIYPTVEELEKEETIACKVIYMEEDVMTFNLVALLFAKKYLNKPDEEIVEAMRRIAA